MIRFEKLLRILVLYNEFLLYQIIFRKKIHTHFVADALIKDI